MSLSKSSVRSHVRQLLSSHYSSPSCVSPLSESVHVSEKIFSSSLWLSSSSLAIFLPVKQRQRDTDKPTPVPYEFITAPLIDRAFKEGKRVFVPRVPPSKSVCSVLSSSSSSSSPLPSLPLPRMKLLEIFSHENIHDWPLGPYGCIQPPLTVSSSSSSSHRDELLSLPSLTLFFIPALAFDPVALYRLGHGAGYYDEYLNYLIKLREMNGEKRPLLIGLSLEKQLVEGLPHDQTDVPLDIILHWKSETALDTRKKHFNEQITDQKEIHENKSE